jgi:outer membrane receptor protein involved in Fe transport
MKQLAILAAFLCTGLIFSTPVDPDPDLRIGTISGIVIDKLLQKPVPYAAVIVKLSEIDSTITGGITLEDGSFELKNIPEGNFTFLVQFIGYESHSQPVAISRGNRKVDLGTIELEEAAEELSGVEVVAERTTIEQRIDRKVINVGKDLTTAGATASDIMNNLPSINLDQQTGELSMRGNSNVRVMVDGKLSNVPVAQLLRQIPSTSIKSIELITNPSAKYNPEGMSGIINIILHKNANNGFNGNINTGLTVGQEAKFNSSLDLNYRNGGINLYGNAGTNIGKWVNDGFIFRSEERLNQDFDFFNNNKSYLYKLGIDFYINDHHTLSFFTNQNIYDGKGNGSTEVAYLEAPMRNTTQFFANIEDNHSEQYNMVYKWDFLKEGHNLELEYDYNRFKSDEDATFSSTGATVFPDYMDFVETHREQTIANLDYVNPLDSITKVEAGLEARIFETDVDYASTGLTFNEDGQLRPTPATRFIYGMDIYSGYATFGQNYDKWSYQAGLRVEDVEVKADTNGRRSFTDSYTQFYPSAFLTYKPSDKNQFQLSYSRRVDRPGLTQVNPIREWSTPLISSIGNPALVPQFTNSYELNYTRRLQNGSITTGVFYRSIQDEINRMVFVDRLDLNKLILTYGNFDNTSAYGVEVSTNYNPFKWWSINGSFDLYQQTQRGLTERLPTNNPDPAGEDIIVEEVEVDNTAWNLRMNNSFKATDKLTFQLFAFYRAANDDLQISIRPMYFINTGARYSFADGKGTFSLNFNDIFNTMRFAFDGRLPYVQNGRFNWESQNVYAGISYRFGSGKDRALQRKRRDDNTKEAGGGIL